MCEGGARVTPSNELTNDRVVLIVKIEIEMIHAQVRLLTRNHGQRVLRPTKIVLMVVTGVRQQNFSLT